MNNKLSRFFEVMKAGEATDSSGKKHNITVDNLKEIVNQFKVRENDVPLVIGHPKTDSPAYGWLESLKIEGTRLLARGKEIADAFKTAVDEKRYKYVSLSLGPNWELNHVGFLGAANPGVPGLKPVTLADGTQEVIFDLALPLEFCLCEPVGAENEPITKGTIDAMERSIEYRMNNALRWLMRPLRALRDYIVSKEGIEAANKIIDPYYMGDVKFSAVLPEIDADISLQNVNTASNAVNTANMGHSTDEVKETPNIKLSAERSGKEAIMANDIVEKETEVKQPPGTEPVVDMSAQFSALQKENTATRERLAAQDAENKRLSLELSKVQAEGRKSKVAEFMKTNEGKIKEEDRVVLTPMLQALLENPSTFEFSNGGGVEKKDMYDALTRHLAAGPDLVPMGEFAGKDKQPVKFSAGSDEDINMKVIAYQNANPGVTYMAALATIANQFEVTK